MTSTSWDLDDWRLSDKNPLKVAAVATAVLAVVIAGALNLTRIPLLNRTHDYTAYLTNASGLTGAETVQVRGVRVGRIKAITLDGNRVKVKFEVKSNVRLGTETTAAVKVLNPLGSQFLELTSAGPGKLDSPIPTNRTSVSRTLVTELGRVSSQVGEIDIAQLQKALDTTTRSLSGTSAKAVTTALTGLNAFAGNLAEDSDAISALVREGSSLAKTINGRRGDLVNLITQGDALAAVLSERRSAIQALISGTSDLSKQVSSILKLNQEKFTPMLANVTQIAQALAKENVNLGKAIPALANLSDNVARATGTGRFIDVVVPNGLIPDSLIQQCRTGSSYPAPDKPIVGCRP